MEAVQAASARCLALLAVAAATGGAQAADLAPVYRTAPVIAAPAGVPLSSTAIMVSPIRTWNHKPIQTHIIARPAPNPRAVGEGPVFGPAYPVIIVVKP